MEGKVAVVTGGSRGIGLEIAEVFLQSGAKVAVLASSADSVAKALAHLQERYASPVMGVACNVADLEEVTAAMGKIEAELGPIQVLVNNAGITRDALFLRMGEDKWDEVISVNLKGVFNCTKAVFRSMVKNRYGRIVNVTSVVGITGNVGQANYAAAKAGVIGFTKTIAREGAPYNILCNAVAPGFITTQMTEKIPEKLVSAIVEQIPLKKFGTPRDVAMAVKFLAAEDNQYITGQILGVDGGIGM
jgi:3-oxoacyl-[acyl-carrier protein] reductase